MPKKERALKPEDLTRLFVERANEGDAAGLAELYEEQAVMAYPPGSQTARCGRSCCPTPRASSPSHRCRP